MKPSDNVLTDEHIAPRAYEKWRARGCPLWDDKRDWYDARAELAHELVAAVEQAVGAAHAAGAIDVETASGKRATTW